MPIISPFLLGSKGHLENLKGLRILKKNREHTLDSRRKSTKFKELQ